MDAANIGTSTKPFVSEIGVAAQLSIFCEDTFDDIGCDGLWGSQEQIIHDSLHLVRHWQRFRYKFETSNFFSLSRKAATIVSLSCLIKLGGNPQKHPQRFTPVYWTFVGHKLSAISQIVEIIGAP